MTAADENKKGSVLRIFVLPLVLGGGIALAAAGSYWGLEKLLASCADHDRGLWEGAVLVLAINGGNAFAHWVLRRVDMKKEDLS